MQTLEFYKGEVRAIRIRAVPVESSNSVNISGKHLKINGVDVESTNLSSSGNVITYTFNCEKEGKYECELSVQISGETYIHKFYVVVR